MVSFWHQANLIEFWAWSQANPGELAHTCKYYSKIQLIIHRAHSGSVHKYDQNPNNPIRSSNNSSRGKYQVCILGLVFSLSSASHLMRFNPMISSSLKGWFFYLCVIYVCLTDFRSPFLSPSVIPIRVRSQMHFNLASTKWIADEIVTFWLCKQCNI